MSKEKDLSQKSGLAATHSKDIKKLEEEMEKSSAWQAVGFHEETKPSRKGDLPQVGALEYEEDRLKELKLAPEVISNAEERLKQSIKEIESAPRLPVYKTMPLGKPGDELARLRAAEQASDLKRVAELKERHGITLEEISSSYSKNTMAKLRSKNTPKGDQKTLEDRMGYTGLQ